MRVRKYLLLILAVLVAVTVAACAKKEGEVVDFSQVLTKKVEIWAWLDDEKGDYAKELIAEFNKTEAGKNITVRHRHEGSVESRDRLKVVGPTGGGPDVFQFPHDHLAPAILEDLLYALPQSTKQLVEQRSHPLGAQIAQVQYDDATKTYGPSSNAQTRLFAMPTSIESVGLYYNKKLIKEADVPKTMEDLISKAKIWNAQKPEGSTLTNAENGYRYFTTSSHFADSYFMQGFYSAFGFYPFGEDLDDKDNVGLDSTAVTNALTWFRDELKPVVSGTSTDAKGFGNHFEEGKIPLIIAGPWNIEAYTAAKDVIELGVAPMPSINGQPARTFAGAIMTAVYKYSRNIPAAVAFVEFMNSDKAMELLYKHKGKLPALKSELLSNIPGVTADA